MLLKVRFTRLGKNKIVRIRKIRIKRLFRVVCMSRRRRIRRKLINLIKLINNLRKNG